MLNRFVLLLVVVVMLVDVIRGDDDNDNNAGGDKAFEVSDTLHPELGVVFPVTLSALLLIFNFGMMVHSIYNDPQEGPQHEPEKQINLVACMAENAEYEYKVVFQVGCPTGDFSMKRNYIDFEIIGPDNEVMGTPVRFQCARLQNKIFGEMHCLVGRISPMPPLQGIRAVHSDARGNSIYFYEYYVADLKTDKLLERLIVHDYITNSSKVFRGRRVHHGEQEEDVNIFPALPVPELGIGEMLVLLSHSTMFTFMLAMLFEVFSLYLFDRHSAGSLWRSLQCIAFVAPIVLLELFVLILVFKYYIKRRHQHYLYSSQHVLASLWHHICIGFLVFLVKLSIMAGVVCFYFGLKIPLGHSLYWLGSVLNILVLMIGVWACCNKMLVLKAFFEERPYETAQDNVLGVAVPKEKTVYFDNTRPSLTVPMLKNPRTGNGDGSNSGHSLKSKKTNKSLGRSKLAAKKSKSSSDTKTPTSKSVKKDKAERKSTSKNLKANKSLKVKKKKK